MIRVRARCFCLAALAASCENAGEDCREQASQAIFRGSVSSGLVHLAPAQQRALGLLAIDPSEASSVAERCTGTLVAANWVLTVGHCAHAHSFSPWSDAGAAVQHRTRRAVWHPTQEIVLLELEPAPSLADVEPLAVLDEVMDASWVGVPVELAGFGLTETAGLGTLHFAVEAVSKIDAGIGIVTVDGLGRSGACAGDSGGPLLTRGSDGTVRIAGLLLAGDISCTGEDHYLIAGPLRHWIVEITTPIPPAPRVACAGMTAVGGCFRSTAVWCGENGSVRAERCDQGRACGWDLQAVGFRCVDPAHDPCNGIDDLGVCRDAAAVHCLSGRLTETHCAGCGRCARSPASGLVRCE